MGETKGSLKAYFIIVGLFETLTAVYYISTTSSFLNLVPLAIGIMLLYYGIKLYDYLQRAPKTLKNFVIVISIINVFVGLLSGRFGYVIGAPLLGWYLVHNINKLSKGGTGPKKETNSMKVEKTTFNIIGIIGFLMLLAFVLWAIFKP